MFYREAGSENERTIVLLHGFPSFLHMFRDLIPKLGERFHVIAPDYTLEDHSETIATDILQFLGATENAKGAIAP